MVVFVFLFLFFFSSRRRHTRCSRDWSSDVCSSDLRQRLAALAAVAPADRRLHPDAAVVGGAEEPVVTVAVALEGRLDRKSTRLNSSHGYISYAVFCLKKKKNNTITYQDRLVDCYVA